MNNALRTQLLEVAEAYCSVKSIALSTLSHKIVNDGKVLPRLKAGGHDIKTETFEEFMAWFRDNWPSNQPLRLPLPISTFRPFLA